MSTTTAPRPATASEAAYRQLKAMILDNALPPGAQLLEAGLALRLGLSRTPVREAMLRLERDGLATVTPRHGLRVRPISAADMRDIYDVLESLEPKAAELLARRHPDEATLRPLDAACRAMEAAIAAEDRIGWARADEDFHRGLAEASGNARLAEMVMQVWDQAHRARLFTLNMRPLPQQSTAEHRATLDAIAAGDAPRAAASWRAHRQRGGLELLTLIERSGLPWL